MVKLGETSPVYARNGTVVGSVSAGAKLIVLRMEKIGEIPVNCKWTYKIDKIE